MNRERMYCKQQTRKPLLKELLMIGAIQFELRKNTVQIIEMSILIITLP